jgi:anti-anti-sigma factor
VAQHFLRYEAAAEEGDRIVATQQVRGYTDSRLLRLSERAEPFSVEIQPGGDRTVVMPHGELDLATVDLLSTELDGLVARGCDTIVLDLRGTSFMDSTGLRLVVRQAAREDATVTLIDGPAAVSRLFDLTGLRASLPFEDVS